MALNLKGIMKRMTAVKKNPKDKSAAKSKPVGYKNAKVKPLKGGTDMTKAGRKRGGYGAARANLGFAAANGPIRPVIGRGR